VKFTSDKHKSSEPAHVVERKTDADRLRAQRRQIDEYSIHEKNPAAIEGSLSATNRDTARN
jgi:hypothetical protein